MFGYIYIREHTSYDNYNLCKLGKTMNIPERDSQYATSEIKRGKFSYVYEVNDKQLSIIERLLQYELKEYNIRYDGGTEFYDKIITEQIKDIFKKYRIEYRQLNDEDISNLMRHQRIRKILNKINIRNLINFLKTVRKNDINMYNWKPREYQQEIINYCTNELLENNKIYIELPTGGGKSFIVYNLLRILQSEFIIIFSPRKIINSQNISFKYLQLLNKTFKVFDYSINNNIEDFIISNGNKILICCTQSVKKIYNFIKNISNISIWFDEAHWGIEEWINKLSDNLEFNYLLTDTINIKYKIFTSASPDKQLVNENINIFGKLYSPIKVNELIKLKWLTPIKPYIYSENKENINKVNYILSEFTNKNRNFGFSFHNYQPNAFNLFYDHYNEYKNNITNIKPFLLIGDDFNEKKESKLNYISLDYYYRDVKTFEENINSIAYVVAKYSIGYDFNKIDFISLTDRKLSIKDIIQSIGRGIRSDELGIDGKNLNKLLMILLPIYVNFNEDLKTEYSRIIDVLKYLLYDVEIPLDEFEFIQKIVYSPPLENIGNFKKYNGLENIQAVILDLLEYDRIINLRKEMTYGRAKNILSEKNIKSKKEYFELCKTDLRFYENPNEIYSGQFENWVKYLGIPKIYYNFQTCKNKIDEYLIKYPEIKNNHLDLSSITIKLCEIDENFPSSELWCDYYNLNNLNELININNKKKKRNLCIF
jgi:hypothetical protein